jgi:hypothetical protein
MTKENLTSINVIIDASGSMSYLTHDTIGNFNTFLAEQKVVPGEAVFTLCTFNSDYRLTHDFVKIASVPALTNKTYIPQGGTALLDAMGTTINSVGQKLAAMPEDERPSKVIFLIITDGHENASRNFNSAQIKEMVSHQRDKYSWEFVFMGANIDAIAAGTNLGISMNNTMNYEATKGGTHKLFNTISESMTHYRGGAASTADFFSPKTTTTTTTTTVTPSTPKTSK